MQRAVHGFLALLLAVAALLAPDAAVAADTLAAIQKRGYIACGVAEGATGFSSVDERGVWSGLDVDLCAGLAAAVLGRKDAVKYIGLTAIDRFQALKNGAVDVLARGTTWTLTRETELGLRFAPPVFYDGLGFLVRRGQAVGSVLELSGASVCMLAGSHGAQSLAEFFAAKTMKFAAVVSEHWAEMVAAYRSGTCTVLAGDISVLARERAVLPKPADHMILPETVTKEPYALAVRQGDERWFSVARWTVLALIAAEELGIARANAAPMRTSKRIDVRRLLGLDGNLGQSLGLKPGWAFDAIKAIGNYGEIFDRNLGAGSALKLERGLNALWSNRGLMYAPPLR